MRNSIKNINRLYNAAYNSIFTINGGLSYDRVTDCLISLAEMVQETETGEFTLQEIGEFNEACLADLIIGAFWHFTEWHGGQNSKGYRAYSAISCLYSPGMQPGPEPDTGEYSAYEMLDIMATADNSRIFDNGGESADRYTIFPYLNSDDETERRTFLGFTPGGRGVSMWGEVSPDDLGNLSFLGEEIPFCSLDLESRNHVIMRLQD